MFLSRFVKGELFSNGRYMKGVSLLPKMVYKRVRDRTSGRSFPVLNSFSTPSPPPGGCIRVDVFGNGSQMIK